MHFDDTKAQKNNSAKISIIELLEDIPNREILGGKTHSAMDRCNIATA
jgi:hypothetical protein